MMPAPITPTRSARFASVFRPDADSLAPLSFNPNIPPGARTTPLRRGFSSPPPETRRMVGQRTQTRFDSKNYTGRGGSEISIPVKFCIGGGPTHSPPVPDGSRALVIVLDADDIPLAEIAPGLNLDQFQEDLARIFQPMDGADRDIDRFVLVHDLDGLVDRHARSAPHHDPMLGAMVLLLQRAPAAGLDEDTRDLV